MSADEAAMRGKRVLVAEDYASLAKLFQRYLEDFGCEVLGPVPSLAKAMPLASDQTIDCALLDVSLRDGLVFPLAARLRERSIPFVFTTGYDDDALIPDNFQDARRLVKPFTEEQLLNCLTQAMGVSAGAGDGRPGNGSPPDPPARPSQYPHLR